MPVCIAETQALLSDKPNLLGRPKGFTLNVREVSVSAGAGFVVAIAGNIMQMPGLGKVPAAAALLRTSFSTIVRESNDFGTVLMDANGDSLSENTGGIPSFSGILPRTLKHFLVHPGKSF